MAAPVFGQYAGPAVLTRGEAPAAMEMPDIDFRPYIFAGLSYDTGLAGVSVNPATGALAESSSYGVALQWGLSGSHSWRHTHLGVNYSGLLNHYAQRSYYDGINQTMMIGLTHALTRHMTLSIFESGGMFSRQYRTDALAQTVPFDPSTLYTPNTDYFDNRTYFSSTNAGLTWQESARLSMHVAGGYYMTSRRSQALTGTAARSATGDIQYRLSRRTTIGGTYTFSHYGFSRVQGGSDGHAFAGVYSVRISRSVEFSGYGGVMRVESKFIQTLAVDPAIAALLGLAADSQIGQQIYHTIDTIPYWERASPRWFRGGCFMAARGARPRRATACSSPLMKRGTWAATPTPGCGAGASPCRARTHTPGARGQSPASTAPAPAASSSAAA